MARQEPSNRTAGGSTMSIPNLLSQESKNGEVRSKQKWCDSVVFHRVVYYRSSAVPVAPLAKAVRGRNPLLTLIMC